MNGLRVLFFMILKRRGKSKITMWSSIFKKWRQMKLFRMAAILEHLIKMCQTSLIHQTNMESLQMIP